MKAGFKEIFDCMEGSGNMLTWLCPRAFDLLDGVVPGGDRLSFCKEDCNSKKCKIIIRNIRGEMDEKRALTCNNSWLKLRKLAPGARE